MRRELAAIGALLACGDARGDEIDARATTLIAGHADPRDGQIHTVVPVYELVSARAEIDAPARWLSGLELVVSGWGEVALGDPAAGRIDGDLDLAYLEGRLFGDRLDLRLGRQIVAGGAARITPLDGAVITTRPFRGAARGLGLTVYGGVPVAPRFAEGRGDFAAGGRLFYRPTWATEVGASFIEVLGGGRAAREDAALDVRWAPHRAVAVTGLALLSVRELRIAQAELQTELHPTETLDLAAGWRRTAPDLFLPRNSILSVFSQETRDEVGGDASLRVARHLDLTADYHAVHEEDGWGHRGGAGAKLRLGAARQTTVGAEARLLLLPENGYYRARIYLAHRFADWASATLDADAYRLTQPINGTTLSFTARGSLAFRIAAAWQLVLAAMADTNPLVERRFELLAKLVWDARFALRPKRVRK